MQNVYLAIRSLKLSKIILKPLLKIQLQCPPIIFIDHRITACSINNTLAQALNSTAATQIQKLVQNATLL
jgi:hypothetical protein